MNRIELNGAPAGSLDLAGAFGYGHFTAMQVRDGKVRGLDVHLDRLGHATLDRTDTRLGACSE